MRGAIQSMTADVTELPDGGATDDDLVSLATQGNRAAFEALLRRHYDLMHRVAWRMTGSQTDAQDICQDVCCALVERIASFRGEAKFTTWLVGIVRNEGEMQEALHKVAELKTRAEAVKVGGNREYNPGWHTALDLENLLTVTEAVARCAIERKESRGGHFREDFPDKDPECAKWNSVVSRGADGSMQFRREPIKELPAELKAVIEENK